MSNDELLTLAREVAERTVAQEVPKELAKRLGPTPGGWLHDVRWTATLDADESRWRVTLTGGLWNANEEQAAEAIAPWAEWLGVPAQSHHGEIEVTREIAGVKVTVFVVADQAQFEAAATP